MKAVRYTLMGLAVAAVLFVLASFLLPDSYRVERSIHIKANPERVFTLIEDPREWRRWSAWNRRDPAMTISYSGPARGEGAGWQWRSASQGQGEMRFLRVTQDKMVEYELYFPDFDSRPTGAFRLIPRDGGTEVRWSMDGRAGLSPFMRWMNLFMDAMVGRDFEEGLAELKAIAESDASPAL